MLQNAISGATKLANNIWRTATSPIEIDRLGRAAGREPGPSIIYVPVVTEVSEGTILFPSIDATVVNRGTLDDTIIIACNSSGGDKATPKNVRAADRDFIAEAEAAGPDVGEFAKKMLQTLRELDPEGQLVAFPGRRFINKPDNFIVLVPQPRVRELKIVVRGNPREFENAPSDLKADQNGYSTFKIRSATDLAHAVKLLRQVRRKR